MINIEDRRRDSSLALRMAEDSDGASVGCRFK